jgi:hypothetical protein
MSYRTLVPMGLILISPLLGACAGASGDGTRASAPANLITREMVEQTHVSTAFELVQNVRPRWLQDRGPTSLDGSRTPVQIYLDGSRYGGPEALQAISLDAIEEMRYLGAADATTRFGTGHGGGVILVTTRRR